MEDRRNVGENSCNSGDGTDQTGPILDVYDDDDAFYIAITLSLCILYGSQNKQQTFPYTTFTDWIL